MKKAMAIILSIILILAITLPATAVSTIAVKSIKLNNSKISLKVGEVSNLIVTFTPVNTSQKKLTYVTSNKNVVTVNTVGEIKGVHAGNATITVLTLNQSVFAKCNVTVSQPGKASVEDKKPAHISFFTTQSRNKEIRKQMADTMLNDEKITVEWQVVPDPQYNNLVLTKIAANELPDILDLNILDDFSTYLPENFADLSNEPWVKRLVKDSHLKAPDGKIYAMPLTAPSIGIGCWYNKKVFADAGITSVPVTYADFLADLEKIKAKSIVPIYMSNKDLWTTQIFGFLAFQDALGNNGLTTYSKLEKNQLQWKDVPEFKQMLLDFQALFTKGYTNKNHGTATYEMAKENVATGKAAIMINGNWAATDIAAKWPEADIGFFPLPYNDSTKMLSSDTVWGYPVSKNSKHLEDAKRFLNLWSQPKYMNMYFSANPGAPAFKDVDGGKLNKAEREMVDNYVLKGSYFTKTINEAMPSMAAVYGDTLWPLYVGLALEAKTADQVLTEWQKKYSEFMKSKKMPGF